MLVPCSVSYIILYLLLGFSDIKEPTEPRLHNSKTVQQSPSQRQFLWFQCQRPDPQKTRHMSFQSEDSPAFLAAEVPTHGETFSPTPKPPLPPTPNKRPPKGRGRPLPCKGNVTGAAGERGATDDPQPGGGEEGGLCP